MDANPVADDFLPEVQRRPWMDNLVRPILLIIMVSCLSLALINFVRAINPAWHGAYFLVGMVLVTIEAVYSSRILTIYRSKRYESVIRFRLVEWGILLILLKLLSYAGKSWNTIWNDIQAIARNPDDILSIDFVIFLTLAFIVWLAVTQTMKDFENLYDAYYFRSATLVPYNRLVARFFWGGGILIVLSGITRWMVESGLESLLNLKRPTLGGIIVNVLIYFMLGLVLLSQAQLTTLFTRWEIQKVSIASDIAKRWLKYGLITLALITSVIFFLPTGYTLGFLNSLGLLFTFIIGMVFFIFQLIALFFTLILYFLANLFGTETEQLSAPTPPPPALTGFPAAPPVMPSVPWLEVLRSPAFWLIALAMVVYLLRTYLKDHPEILDWLKKYKLIRLYFGWLGKLWQWLIGAVQSSLDLIPKRVKLTNNQAESTSRFRWRWPRLGSMSPRERILYYYLNTLTRAERAGAVRQKHQTPIEFVETLNETIPNMESENSLLTEAFVHARYSQDIFDTEHASLVRTIWQQVRTALRQVTKQRQQAE